MNTKQRSLKGIFMALVMIFSLFGVMPQVEMEASAAYENTWTNTGNQRRDIVEIAKTQIGYHEGSLEGTTNGSNNYTKYNVDLYKIDGSYNYMWCQSFVAWCAKQAGVPSSEIKRTAGTIDAMDFFKSKGTWKGRDYTPQSGDIIYFYSSSSNSGYHVGIVSDISNGQINTIEGNYSNKVATHSVALFSSSIVGYGCPNYSEPVPNPPTWANISISKLKYAIGENVTFSFSSDTATAYNIGIHKNGEPYDILWGVTGNDYSYYLKEAGSYYAYVNAYNSSGNKDSQGIWFDVYGTAPNESVISIDKTKYTIGEDIIFNISSDTATAYNIGIHKNGEPYDILWDITDNIYSYCLKEAGSYYAYVNAYNSLGNKDSQGIWFDVYDTAPNESVISIDKTKYTIGENIIFNISSDTATAYNIGIHKNGEPYDILWSVTDNVYSYCLKEAGSYYAYVNAYNSLGNKDSQGIWFNVYDPDELNISNIVILQKYILGIQSLTQEQAKFADMTQDGIVNILDLSVLKHKILS